MKRAPGTHWIGGWVGPRAILDAVVKRKIPSPPGIEPQNPDCPVRSLVAIPTELSRLSKVVRRLPNGPDRKSYSHSFNPLCSFRIPDDGQSRNPGLIAICNCQTLNILISWMTMNCSRDIRICFVTCVVYLPPTIETTVAYPRSLASALP
jgi:hypothetical protein